MPNPLTPAEIAAIAEYTGPVTVCPPNTFTEDMAFDFYSNRRITPTGTHQARKARQMRREDKRHE